jgi:hypothetical protein
VSLADMILKGVRCVKCGVQGVGNCTCWEQCSCGWTAEAGKPCGNPQTKDCSTKLKYGPGQAQPMPRVIATGKLPL